MHINLEGFLNTLPILAYGMAGIFAVILTILFTVKLLGWVMPEKKEDKDN